MLARIIDVKSLEEGLRYLLPGCRAGGLSKPSFPINPQVVIRPSLCRKTTSSGWLQIVAHTLLQKWQVASSVVPDNCPICSALIIIIVSPKLSRGRVRFGFFCTYTLHFERQNMSLSLSQAKASKCTTGGITKRLHDSTGRRKPKSQFFHFSVHKCIVSIVTNNFDLKDNFWWFHDNLYHWWRFSWSFLLFCNVVSPCTRQALVISFQWFLKGRNFTNGNTEILYGR